MPTRRIGLVVAIALTVLVPHRIAAQPGTKMPRIGILDAGIPHLFVAFRQGLQDFGYVEGQNVAFDVRSASGRPDDIPLLARELVRANPDVIVSAGTLPLQILKRETSTIPIVAA